MTKAQAYENYVIFGDKCLVTISKDNEFYND